MANSSLLPHLIRNVPALSGSPGSASFSHAIAQAPPLATVGGNSNSFAGSTSYPGRGSSNVDFSSRRCREKGCVFPVASSETGRCLQHDRQISEPALFHSHQPSMLLLDRAKFGLPDHEPDDSRARDRRRFAMLREARLEEGS
ncbi:MAG TPA: hypothetical protein VFD30_14575 [Terriglobia bacterium]|nr:hypothetical protein [Terriglobia bacterium]